MRRKMWLLVPLALLGVLLLWMSWTGRFPGSGDRREGQGAPDSGIGRARDGSAPPGKSERPGRSWRENPPRIAEGAGAPGQGMSGTGREGTKPASGKAEGEEGRWEDVPGGPDQAGIPVLRLKHDGPIRTLAFNNTGDFLAAGSSRVILWDVASGRKLFSESLEPGTVTSLDFSPMGDLLASSAGDGIVLWGVPGGEKRLALKAEMNVQKVSFSGDGSLFAAVGIEEKVLVYRTDHWAPPDIFLQTGMDRYQHMAFMPGSGVIGLADGDGKTMRLDPLLRQLTVPQKPPWGRFYAISADLKHAVVEDSGKKKVVTVPDGKGVIDLEGQILHGAAFSGDGKTLAVCLEGAMRNYWEDDDFGREIQLWDVASRKQKKPLRKVEGYPKLMTLSGNGRRLAAVNSYGLFVRKIED